MLCSRAYCAASRSHSAARPGLSGSSRQPYSPMAIGVSPSHASASSALLPKLRQGLPLVGDQGL